MGDRSSMRVPRLGPDRSFPHWESLFKAELVISGKVDVLLDDGTGDIVSPGPAGAEVPVPRGKAERLLHSMLLLAAGPGNDPEADPGSPKAFEAIQEFNSHPYRGTAAFEKLRAVFAPQQEDTLSSLFLQYINHRPGSGADVVAVCD